MPSKDPSGSTRRRFLQTLGAGIAISGIAGCVGQPGESGADSAIGHPGNRPQPSQQESGAAAIGGPYRRHERDLHWNSTPVTFVVGTNTYPDGLDEEAVTDAVTRSFDAWNAVPGAESVFGRPQFDTELEEITFENGVNEIVWEEMDDDALGRANWRWATNTSRLLEVDIRLNPDREWFVDESTDGDSAYDVQSVLMHELGHNALLDIQTGPQQTMFHETDPGATKKRTLGDGDKTGWRDAYGIQ